MTIEETHENLLKWVNKPESELRRKAIKAMRIKQKIWTQEEIDYAKALAKKWEKEFR